MSNLRYGEANLDKTLADYFVVTKRDLMRSRGRSKPARNTTLAPLNEEEPQYFSGHYSGNRNNRYYKSLSRNTNALGRTNDQTRYIENMTELSSALR